MFKKEILGIEIEEDAIKFLVSEHKSNKLHVKDFFIAEIPNDIENKGEFAYKKIGEVIKEKKWGKMKVNFVIPTGDIQSRGIKIPEIPLEEVEIVVNREIKKIYGELKDKRAAYQILGKQKSDDKVFYNIFFALIPNVIIEKLETLKLKIDNFDLKMFSEERLLKHFTKEDENTLVIDIGHAVTILMMYKGKSLEIYREINIAGEEITKTISNVLQVSYEEAEELKRKYGIVSKDDVIRLTSSGEEPRAAQLNFAYQVVMDKLLRKISHSIDYFKTQNRGDGINKAYLLGGGALLGGLEYLIQDEIGTAEVKKLDIGEILDTTGIKDSFDKHMLIRFVNTIGTSLLKEKIIKVEKKRNYDILKKMGKYKRYFLGAAALVPFAIFYLFAQLSFITAKIEVEKIAKESAVIQPLVDEYNKYEEELKTIKNNEGMFEVLIKKDYHLSDFLFDISNETSENIYFSAMKYKYEDKSLSINGSGISRDGFPEIFINDFVRSLENKYSEVHLKGTQKTLQESYSVAVFDVDMKLETAVSKK